MVISKKNRSAPDFFRGGGGVQSPSPSWDSLPCKLSLHKFHLNKMTKYDQMRVNILIQKNIISNFPGSFISNSGEGAQNKFWGEGMSLSIECLSYHCFRCYIHILWIPQFQLEAEEIKQLLKQPIDQQLAGQI